jgi:hypothetical protein
MSGATHPDTASHSRRLDSSALLLLKLHFSHLNCEGISMAELSIISGVVIDCSDG